MDRIAPDGTIDTKAHRIKTIGEDKTVIVSEVSSDYRVDVYGGTAIITGLTTVVSKAATGNTTERFRWTDAWIKQSDGHWLCVAEQSARLAK